MLSLETLWLNTKRSVASPMDIDKAEWAAVHADIDNVDKGILRCQKNDGRSWQCKKEAKEGFLFCEHHIRRSYNCNNNVTSNGNIPSDSLLSKKASAAPAAPAKAISGTRRARPKAVRKGASSANPYEYYYYSGFGPKWGRKRGKKDEEEEEEEAKIEAAAENDGTSSSTSTENIDPQPSPPHNIDNGDQLDYMEDDFEDEDEDGSGEEGGRRRMRRPVKARSLMSIINVQAKE